MICVNGCCKSDLESVKCIFCEEGLDIRKNCECSSNIFALLISWKTNIKINIKLINGGDSDNLNIVGCSECIITYLNTDTV